MFHSRASFVAMPAAPGAGRRGRNGFTLIELMLTIGIVGILASIAIPSYAAVVQRQRTQTSVRDLAAIAMKLEKYKTKHFKLPPSLAQISDIPREDPWGRQYQYLNFNAGTPGIQGAIRKDHNLHPLNTEFDLYSLGPDGASSPPLTAKASRDDIIWARDGGFIGVAEDY